MAANIYETPRLLEEYLLFHYGTPEQILPWEFGPRDALGFPVRTVSELLDPARLQPNARALDLGCAVGRSAFELGASSTGVLGIDFSRVFIDAANSLRDEGSVKIRRHDEGDHWTELTLTLPDTLDRSGIQFATGDAMNLDPDLGSFDVVHAANLLCRLSDPEKLLNRLPDLVKPGGQLLLTTPCTWLAEFTPRSHWPKLSTRDWLQATLQDHFVLELQKDMPFLIREHARKYQWSVALATRWVRGSIDD